MHEAYRVLRRAVQLACAVAIVSACQGQERKIGLQEAIDLAIRQNHGVKMARYEVAAEEQEKRIAYSNYFPNITNESNALYVTNLQRIEVPPGAFGVIPGGAPIPASTVYLTQGEQSFQSSGTMLAQPLTQLIKIHDANKIAEADLKISESAERKTVTDVVFEVQELYYRVLTTQLRRNAAQLQIASSEESLAEAREQNKNGSLLEVALIESRANSLEAKQTLLTADMQISTLATQLNDVMGLPLETKLVLNPDVNTALDVPAREEAQRIAVRDNPEIQEAVQKVAKARAAEGAAKAEYIPDVTAFARHSYQNGVPFVDHNFGTFGVHFTYDLFDAGKRRSLIRERRDRVSEAEENLERMKEEVGVRITTIYNRLETTRTMVDVAKESLSARQESARLTENQFKDGISLASQRDAARAQAMKAQAGLLEASLDYLLTRDELTRVLGASAK
jgi:outer membrane protein TolC